MHGLERRKTCMGKREKQREIFMSQESHEARLEFRDQEKRVPGNAQGLVEKPGEPDVAKWIKLLSLHVLSGERNAFRTGSHPLELQHSLPGNVYQ